MATEIADNLRKEIDAERSSSVALLAEVKLLKEQLDGAKTLGLAAAEAYTTTLVGFGRVTPSHPAEASASNLFTWMSSNFAKLPNFIGKVVDFAALSSATNLARFLAEGGCEHVEGVKRKKGYEDPAGLGEIPKLVSSAVRHFMSYFWCKFGRLDARSLVEAHQAEVYLRALVFSYLELSSFLL